jgi:hypothetical protein
MQWSLDYIQSLVFREDWDFVNSPVRDANLHLQLLPVELNLADFFV